MAKRAAGIAKATPEIMLREEPEVAEEELEAPEPD